VERYVIRGGVAGYERLQLLARVLAPGTSALLDRVEVDPASRCLDIGCGAGDVTFEFAQRVGADGRVTGIDMDATKVTLAKESAARQGLSNVDFLVMNVYEWAEPNSYDVVYCRNLLQHLSRPVDVLRTMWEGVRAGGVIVVEDADFDRSFCDPPNDGFDFWIDSYQRALRLGGGDPLMGRKLHRYFTDAGIPTPELTAIQRVDVTGEAKLLPFSTLEATTDAIISAGIASAERIQVALEQLSDFAADSGALCGLPLDVQAWCRKAT
jgi:ubiquinone/menaquinone biosynthesis C-methylase UbiE